MTVNALYCRMLEIKQKTINAICCPLFENIFPEIIFIKNYSFL